MLQINLDNNVFGNYFPKKMKTLTVTPCDVYNEVFLVALEKNPEPDDQVLSKIIMSAIGVSSIPTLELKFLPAHL